MIPALSSKILQVKLQGNHRLNNFNVRNDIYYIIIISEGVLQTVGLTQYNYNRARRRACVYYYRRLYSFLKTRSKVRLLGFSYLLQHLSTYISNIYFPLLALTVALCYVDTDFLLSTGYATLPFLNTENFLK